VADRLRGTVLVGGDLNEKPGGPSWRALREAGYVDYGSQAWPTYPADHPEKRIDALLVRGGAPVVHHGDPGVEERLQAQASDHRAVLAVLDL
jgi:endonuclease/exonuclease/phosphatase family metal-dependent hydrolase